MRLSTKTMITLGVIQCIILSLILVLFMRWQKGIEEEMKADAPTPTTTESSTPVYLPDETKKDKEPTLPPPPSHAYPPGIEPV